MDAGGREVYGVGDEDVVESEHHRADSDDGEDKLGALCGVGEGDAEEPEEYHAWDKGDLSAVLVGNVPHKGVCNYAYGLQERCVDPDL